MELDPQRILSELGFSRTPDKVTRVSGGWDTTLWRVDSQGRSFALRVFSVEQARTSQREAVVMRALSEQGLPVPALRAEGVGQGRPALLLDWCPGRTVMEELTARPWHIWRLGVEMGRMHARIHLASVPAEVTHDFPRVEVKLQESPQTKILHLDYHPLNVMTDGQQITGVLDWSNAKVGDARADLARTVTLMRLAPIPPGFPLPVVRVFRQLLEAAWRRGYREQAGTNPFVEMDPFYVWAGEWMEQDFRPKLGRPGVWLREKDLVRIHQWTTAHKKRASAQSRE